MLPDRVQGLELSAESREKLETFYRMFCTGRNGKRYGFDHMVFAAHAAFPMLLSPELANLTWLNFSGYFQGGQRRKADPVVVSDLLNSGLIRPVGYKQFELLPDVRLFLLFLLQDRKWFSASGVSFQAKHPLKELAFFLTQFLAEKTTTADSDSTNFRQLNSWAVSAYLEPDRLAVQLAAAYRETFGLNGKGAKEKAQLRFALLLRRFQSQVSLSLYEGNPGVDGPLRNLYYFSEGNRARLFSESEGRSSDFYGLVEAPYVGKLQLAEGISLPITIDAGKRLERKKNNVQQLFALFIETGDLPAAPRTPLLSEMILSVTGTGQAELVRQESLSGNAVTKANINRAVSELFSAAADEDLVFIYFSGHSNQQGPYISLNAETLYPAETRDFLATACGKKKTVVFLLLDTALDGHDLFVRDQDIQLCTNSPGGNDPGFWKHFPFLFQKNHAWLTYAHSYAVLCTLLGREGAGSNEFPVLYIPDELKDCLSLSRAPKVLPQGAFPVFFDAEEGAWRVAEQDFINPPLQLSTYITDYDTGARLMGEGKFYRRGLSFLFDGKVAAMDTQRIYLAMPDVPGLAYSIGPGIGPEEEKKVLEAVGGVRIGQYALWGGLVRIVTGVYTADTHPEQWLHIDRGEESRLTVSFYAPFSTMPFHCRIGQIGQLTLLIEKFTRLAYLTALYRPGNAGEGRRPFVLTSECKWQMSNKAIGAKSDTPLELGPGPVYVQNSRVRISPIEIHIISDEGFKVYYQVYLTGADLSIWKLPAANGSIAAGARVRETFNVEKQLTALLLNEVPGVIKILYSRAPFFPDFSQSGFTSKL